MSPDEARQLALSILQSAEAAEQDAFMMHFLSENIGVDKAAVVLTEFRKWRHQEEGPDEAGRLAEGSED